MKRRLFLILALLWALPAAAQIIPPLQIINVVSSGITVCTSGNCATWNVPNSAPSLTAQITGTMTSMTVTFEGTADGQTWFSVSATNLSTASTGTTATATGQYAIVNPGLVGFRVRCTTYSSGAVNVTLTRGSASAKAGLGGGGGGAGVTTITGTTDQVIASAATGAVTLSTPQDIATTSSPLFSNLRLPTSPTTSTTGILFKGTATAANRFLHNYWDQNVNTTDSNLFLGRLAGNFTIAYSDANHAGAGNVGIGDSALVACTSCAYNVVVGSAAATALTTGFQNVIIGNKAGQNITTGSSNVIVGKDAVFQGGSTTVSQVVAIGTGALRDSTNGSDGNTAVGDHAATLNTTGSGNVAIGFNALSANHTGSANTCVGVEACASTGNVSFGSNTSIGHNSLNQLTTGTLNQAMGRNAGLSIFTGENNVFIGYFADSSGGTAAARTNAIAIGHQTKADADNLTILGNSSTTAFKPFGSYYLNAAVLTDSLTPPTIASGGCTSPAVTHSNGTAAFLLTIGTSCTGVKALTLTMPTASHFWACDANNNTSDAQQASNTIASRATSATAVVLTNYARTTGLTADFTASDTLLVKCTGE